MTNFKTLETKIGYNFRRKLLLEEALTHPGCARVEDGVAFNYQRLEFLGDSVLGLVIAEILYGLYPKESEGSLAKRQASLVRADTLVGIARTLQLGDYLILGHADQANRDNPSHLEDSCEALIGAIYLDGGLAVATAFICDHWLPLARGVAEAPKDAKTSLQEWAQGRGLPLPVYRVIETSGPAHAPEFTMEASVDAQHGKAVAKAASKRQAEQLAAAELLKQVGSA